MPAGKSVIYFTETSDFCRIGLWQVKRRALPHHLIALAGGSHQCLAVTDRNLAPAAFDHAGLFEVARYVRDGWPLDTQHFGEHVLGDWKNVVIVAVAHHQEPAREALLQAVLPV